jgi:chaperonin GroL
MRERTYSDFDLLIDGSADTGYRARVVGSPTGETGPVAIEFPFTEQDIEIFLLRIGRPRIVRRGGTRASLMPAVEEFGGKLFDAVFRDQIRVALATSLDKTEGDDVGLRIRLRLADAPELADLPWEFLYDRGARRFLALSDWTPLVRYLEMPSRIRPLSVTAPLRILVMAASPVDFDRLDSVGEKAQLREALADLIDTHRVTLEEEPSGTLTGLQRQLRRGEYHVFHFIGHGGFDETEDDGLLYFEGRNGHSQAVSGQALGELLHDHRSLRLAVLNACEGARSGREDPFAGTAQSLVRQGIPAVVAMQFEITDDAAIAFSHSLYDAVADGYPLDASMAEARKAVRNMPNPVEWATPVLHMRAGDGRVFAVAANAEKHEPRDGPRELLGPDRESLDPDDTTDGSGEPSEEGVPTSKADVSRRTNPAHPSPTAVPQALAEPESETGTGRGFVQGHTVWDSPVGVDIAGASRARRILGGARAVTAPVRRTLGPLARPVVLQDPDGSVRYTTGSPEAARSVSVETLDERIGADLIHSLIDEVRRSAGDGAATAAILAEELIAGLTDLMEQGAHPLALSREIDAQTAAVLEQLSHMTMEVESKEQVECLVSTYAEDSDVGQIIAVAVDKVGKEGAIIVEESNTFGVELELTEGMRFDKGYISPHFVTDEERGTAVLLDPYILLVSATVSAVGDLLPLLEKVMGTGSPLVLIAADVEGDALATLVVNKSRGVFESVAVKAPGLGKWQHANLADLAILTGARLFPEAGATLDGAELADLGRARAVIITQESTTIVEAAGDGGQIENRVNQIRDELENSDSDRDREKLRERLGKLAGGVAVIKVGGRNHDRVLSRMAAFEGGIRVMTGAIRDGIVPGGARVLAVTASFLTAARPKPRDLILTALTAPMRQLAVNAGADADAVLERAGSSSSDEAFDAKTGQFSDLAAWTVFDSADVMVTAVSSAAASARRFLAIL